MAEFLSSDNIIVVSIGVIAGAITIFSAIFFCYRYLKKITQNTWNKKAIKKHQSVIDELNNIFKDTVHFYQVLKEEPILVDEGNYEAEELLINEALKIKGLHTDDPHAFLIPPLNLSTCPITLRYKKLPFSQVTALRERGTKPRLLTANIIAIDIDKQQIILHHRSPESHIYPDRLSIPGGGFWPPDGSGHEDGSHITRTALREFEEETKLTGEICDDTAIVLTEELETGAVQVNFLGAITKIKVNRDPSWEGNVELIHFDELYNILTTREWVPLGKSCVLVWLALGAPGAINAKFDGLTAENLYRKCISKLTP